MQGGKGKANKEASKERPATRGEQRGANRLQGTEREADEGVGSHVRRMWGEGDERLLELEQGDELKARKGVLVEGGQEEEGQEEEGEEGMANVAFEVQSSGEDAIRDRSYVPYLCHTTGHTYPMSHHCLENKKRHGGGLSKGL